MITPYFALASPSALLGPESLPSRHFRVLALRQRCTMEVADTLVGVSMQGAGVTKVISQKLDQALKRAE